MFIRSGPTINGDIAFIKMKRSLALIMAFMTWDPKKAETFKSTLLLRTQESAPGTIIRRITLNDGFFRSHGSLCIQPSASS